MLSDRSSIYLRSSLGETASRTSSYNTTSTTTKSRLTPISSSSSSGSSSSGGSSRSRSSSGRYMPAGSTSSSSYHHQQPYLTQSMLMAHCIASSGTPTVTGYNLASSNIHSNSYRRNYNPSHSSSPSSLSLSSSSTSPSINRYIGTSSFSTSSPSRASRIDIGQHQHASNAMRFMSSPGSGLSSYDSSRSSHHSATNLPPRGLLTSTKPASSKRSPASSASKYSPSSSSSLYRLKLRERPLLSTLSQTLTPYIVSSTAKSYNNNNNSSSSSCSDRQSSTGYSNYNYNQTIKEEGEEEEKANNNSSTSSGGNMTKTSFKEPLDDTKATEDIQWSSDLTRNISRNKYIIKFRELETKQPLELRKASITWDLEQPAKIITETISDDNKLHIEQEDNLLPVAVNTKPTDSSKIANTENSGALVAPPLANNDLVAQKSNLPTEDKPQGNKCDEKAAALPPPKAPKKGIRNLKIKVNNSHTQTAAKTARKSPELPTLGATAKAATKKQPTSQIDSEPKVEKPPVQETTSKQTSKPNDKSTGLLEKGAKTLLVNQKMQKQNTIGTNVNQSDNIVIIDPASSGQKLDKIQDDKAETLKVIVSHDKRSGLAKEKDILETNDCLKANLKNQDLKVVNATTKLEPAEMKKIDTNKANKPAKSPKPKKLAKKSASPKTTEIPPLITTSSDKKNKLVSKAKVKSPKPSDKTDDGNERKSQVVQGEPVRLEPFLLEQQKQQQATSDGASPVISENGSKRIKFREYSFEDFDFISVLGHGGWGFVFLAELKNYDTYFAVKCIKKMTILEDDDLESMMIERKMLTLGNIHPFICKLFCTFENEAYLFFVMEYCAGGDLMFHVQKEGKFSENRCRFYAAEIICAVRFLHNRHIIYRDLKLDNILLDARGHIKLVDFGMCQCRTYREELLPSNFCGTPEYISPEIIKGVPYNHSVDWWSFGVLLYEMAVGKMPFRGSDENELLWNVCYEKIHYPHFLSNELRSLLQLLLERDPVKRLGMATCAAGDIYEQPWFKGVDWKKIEELQVEPPFVPEVRSPKDVQNFDSDFTEATPQLSPVEESTIKKIDQQLFHGFSYTNPNLFFC